MKVEVLFPEICNLYGELENIKYLKKSCPHIEVIETAINDRPLLVSETPDLIYMGTMTESSQQLAIRQLSGYRQRIEELMKDGANFLITGNALEVFGKRIEDVDGTIVDGLGLVDITTKRDMMNRFNSLYIGTFDSGKQQSGDAAGGADPMKIVGFKSQLTHSYWEDGTEASPLFMTERGPGLNPEIKEEGIRLNNFMATYVIGPLLILNPPFARYILQRCGAEEQELAFEEAAMDAYEDRVKEYSDPNTGFYY